MKYAAIGPVAIHLPEKVEDNDFLASQFPRWDMELIFAKTGIRQRHIAAPGECASDLGVAAAEKLFAEYLIDRSTIDFLLFCTQTPDYPLPTTACLIQNRLGLPTSVGALDFNLGCSGFVYGLSLADGLIRSGTARRVLLITAETYSRYIDPTDRSLRTIFGDGAAATLVEASHEPSLGGFVFGTDGSGGDMLLVAEGGARPVDNAIQPRKRKRWPSSLYMDGPELVKFSLDIAPPLIDDVLTRAHWTRDKIDMYLIHQATLFMLDHLRERLSLDREHTPEALEDYGNTVSSTIPILIRDLRDSGRLRPGKQTLLMGFGVGLSWAGCVWTETWAAQQVQVRTVADKAKEAPAEPPSDPATDSTTDAKAPSGDASADSREAA
jgi:3-oxoacyl-[acyl-carrier-protein] synthase III